MMGELAAALGPAEMCCLTGVRGKGDGSPEPGIYRRPRAFARQPLLWAPGFTIAMTEIMLRERPRLVHIAAAYDGYIGLWLKRWLRMPFVVYAYGNEVLDAAKSTWQKPRLALATASRVIAISRFTARLVEQAGVEPAKIELVHPGCDPERFRPLPPRPEARDRWLGARGGSPVLLTVARLVERKGHDTVIKALPLLLRSFPNLVYVVAGSGQYVAELRALVSGLDLGEHVVFAGYVPDAELPDLYAISDVFVMPSREHPGHVEGFGLVYLEASACGKPVVAGRSGGTADAVEEGVTGFLVDPESPEEIAAALGRILQSPEVAGRMGGEGRRRVERGFTWRHFADRVRAVAQAVVEEHSA